MSDAPEPGPDPVTTSPPPTFAQIARALKQHLASLESSGVEWLPLSRVPLPVLSTPGPVAPAMAAAPQPADDPDSPEARRRELAALAERVSACARCPELASTRTQTVFGVGKIDPELCLVGEAPGGDEDIQGEPFVGAAGQLLNRIISAMGFRREDVYICNIIKCRPPRNRTPLPEEAHHCRDYLELQIELVRPKFICTLGTTAAKYLLGTDRSVGSLRGKVQRYKGIPVVCTYHPSYILPGHRIKSEQELREKKKQVWDDMKFLLTQMGRPVEKKPAEQT
jgi:uracil-DNA glycosylase